MHIELCVCIPYIGLIQNTIVLAASQRGCTINAIYCMYSKLPTDDE